MSKSFQHGTANRNYRRPINLEAVAQIPARNENTSANLFSALCELTSFETAANFSLTVDGLTEAEKVAAYEAEIESQRELIHMLDPLAEYRNAPAVESDEVDYSPMGGW